MTYEAVVDIGGGALAQMVHVHEKKLLVSVYDIKVRPDLFMGMYIDNLKSLRYEEFCQLVEEVKHTYEDPDYQSDIDTEIFCRTANDLNYLEGEPEGIVTIDMPIDGVRVYESYKRKTSLFKAVLVSDYELLCVARYFDEFNAIALDLFSSLVNQTWGKGGDQLIDEAEAYTLDPTKETMLINQIREIVMASLRNEKKVPEAILKNGCFELLDPEFCFWHYQDVLEKP